MKYQCTQCGHTMPKYSARRAEYEGCPNCHYFNTIELKADRESEAEDAKR